MLLKLRLQFLQLRSQIGSLVLESLDPFPDLLRLRGGWEMSTGLGGMSALIRAGNLKRLQPLCSGPSAGPGPTGGSAGLLGWTRNGFDSIQTRRVWKIQGQRAA